MYDVTPHRDLLLLAGSGRLVVAVDSVGGIGPKPADSFPVDAAASAHFATRVPLLEVMCAGAQPLVIADALCVEMEPTGREMIAAVRELASEAGVPDHAVTGSTEDNVVTNSTGIGVTIIGQLPQGATERRALPGDVVVLAGLPLSAPRDHLYPGHPGQVSIAAVRAVVTSGLTHDALPVGSKGVGYEVGQLADGLAVTWLDDTVSRTDSGGPSSCVLFACASADVEALVALLGDAPSTALARLE